MARFAVLLISILCFCVDGNTRPSNPKYKDLSGEWFVFENNSSVIKSEAAVNGRNVIHFVINPTPNTNLELISSKRYFLFGNGKLLTEHTGRIILDLDSLATTLASTSITFSIYQRSIDVNDLRTNIHFLDKAQRQTSTAEVKPATYFHDFIVIAGLGLIVFFVIILRTNGKLADEYLSPTRIFSLREALDNQSHVRFAISSNVVFYVFNSLLFSWCLLIIFHNLSSDFYLSRYFAAHSFWMTCFQWLRLAAILLILFFIKSLVVHALSTLFGFGEIAGTHFFNWVRFMIILSGICALVLFVYYIRSGHESHIYFGLLTTIIVLLAGWIITVYLKLNNRVEHSLFHLFSYICATEIIPLLITVKVLFN